MISKLSMHDDDYNVITMCNVLLLHSCAEIKGQKLELLRDHMHYIFPEHELEQIIGKSEPAFESLPRYKKEREERYKKN